MVYTGFVLLTVGLTSCFGLLFLRSLGLHPAAGLSAALGLGFGTALFYWLTFVMFLSAICWSLCLLWLITEFIRKGSWPLAIGLAFATYSLLLTGYPQMTVLMGYMIAGHAVLQLAQRSDSLAKKAWRALALLGCAAAGGVAALPVYLDLFSAAQNSARLAAVSDNFFLAVLPPHHGLRDGANFLLTIWDWSSLGNAIAPEYPLSFNGLSFAPVFGSLIWLSLWMKVGRGVWSWRLFLLFCTAATISSAIYLFAVRHLGFGFSRIQLLCGAIVPGFVLAGYTIDAVVRGNFRLTSWSTGSLFLPWRRKRPQPSAWHIASSPAAGGGRNLPLCPGARRRGPVAIERGFCRSRDSFGAFLRRATDPSPAALHDPSFLGIDSSPARAIGRVALCHCRPGNKERATA